MSTPLETTVTVNKGTCYAIFAYDIGTSIALDEADRRITAGTERGRIRHKARAPQHFNYHPAPLRLMQEGISLTVGAYSSRPTVEVSWSMTSAPSPSPTVCHWTVPSTACSN
jgi:hypothetical protein